MITNTVLNLAADYIFSVPVEVRLHSSSGRIGTLAASTSADDWSDAVGGIISNTSSISFDDVGSSEITIKTIVLMRWTGTGWTQLGDVDLVSPVTVQANGQYRIPIGEIRFILDGS